MSQDWASDLYTTATEANTTLSNMELMFATLKSMFYGAAAPANQVAGMPWFDATKKVMKQRNQGDTAWIGLMHGDASQKVWVYRNAAMDGWAVDSSVSDRVLGLKGGTTYTTGAATAGTWTVSGFAAAANHQHDSGLMADAGLSVFGVQAASVDPNVHSVTVYYWTRTEAPSSGNMYDILTSAAGGHSHSHDGTWRAAAAVGTLQYLDL